MTLVLPKYYITLFLSYEQQQRVKPDKNELKSGLGVRDFNFLKILFLVSVLYFL